MFFLFKKNSKKEQKQRSNWATDGAIWSSIPGKGKRFFSSRKVQTASVAEPAFYSMGAAGSFTVGNDLKWPGREANHSPLSTVYWIN